MKTASTRNAVCMVGLGLTFAATFCASAKTVALWPLATDPLTGELYGQSLVGAADTLAKGTSVEARALSLGWNLPPNPDTSIAYPRFDPTIRGEAYALDESKTGGIFASAATSAGLAAAVFPTHDFTVEGWVRFGKTPGKETGTDEWWVMAYANGGSSGSGGWNFSLRRTSKNLRWVIYQYGGVQDVQLGEAIDTYGASDYAAKEAAFLNRWMHLALVFRYSDSAQANKSTWTLYVDGVKWGSAVQNKYSGGVSLRSFELGGRSVSAANRARLASFAYWRVSDACLEPSAFLNAGGTGTVVPVATTPTKMYWKLGRGANGGLDTRASVGGVTLHGCMFGETANLLSSVSPSAECAFTGNPPNATVTLPSGNVGSIWQNTGSSFLTASNLGRHLTVTNSFTVEGWVRPRRMCAGDSNGHYIFSTRFLDRAWACQFYQRDEAWLLEIFAQDAAGNILAYNAPISPDLRDWHDWKHLALVYDVTGGNGKGEWRAYLDGTLVGTVVNATKPTGDTTSLDFYLGGRYGASNCFYGNLDCFRACRAALAPNQFLNAKENAQAATDVLALWPLNAQNGAYFDCADVVGSYNLVTKREAKHLAASSAESPVVTNPDATATFQGDPVHTDGSAGFRTFGGDNAYLASTRSEVRNVFSNAEFTVECYVRRAQAVDGTWELLFGTTANEPDPTKMQNISLTKASMVINFSYRQAGFVLYAHDANANNVLFDVAFPGTADALKTDTWQHVALTCCRATGKAIWKLYLDGQLRGTLSQNFTGFPKPGSFLLGGRPHSANSFKGAISNVRISSVALEPEQLLCATNATPASEPETLAYWPLDTKGTGLDLASRLLPDFNLGGTYNLSGSAERAAAHPGRPDASATFQGDPRANTGAVAFANGHAHTDLLGDKLDLNTSFTVEGWLKWSHAVTNGLEYLMGTYRYTYTPGGWRLAFDTTGATPKLRVFARGYAPVSVCVDACFDADVSFLENVWTHLALTYENRVGNGTWTLFADGKKLGTVENDWSPNAGTFSHNLFKIGETGDTAVRGFTGLVDMWRVSKGALSKDEFLYCKRGMMILVR